MVFAVRQCADQHAAGHGVERMRANIAGFIGEVGDNFGEFGFCRIAMNIEHINLAIIQSAGPEESPIIGEAHVVRLAAPANR